METDRLTMIQLGVPEYKDFSQVATHMIEHIQSIGKVTS
jgi:hypothetical protein